MKADTLAAIVGLLSLVYTVGNTLYSLRLTRKGITYEITYSQRLLHLKEEQDGIISILVNGHSSSNVALVTLMIKNVGRAPIEPNTYHVPLNLSVNDDAQIHSAQLDPATSEGLAGAIENAGGLTIPEPHRVAIPTVLLNGGDALYIRLFIGNFTALPKLTGHITGVRISEVNSDRASMRMGIGLSLFSLALGLGDLFRELGAPTVGRIAFAEFNIIGGVLALGIWFLTSLLMKKMAFRKR